MTHELFLSVLWIFFGSIGAILSFWVIFGIGIGIGNRYDRLLVPTASLFLGVLVACVWECWVIVQSLGHLLMAISLV